jgi:hypothetical protein
MPPAIRDERLFTGTDASRTGGARRWLGRALMLQVRAKR